MVWWRTWNVYQFKRCTPWYHIGVQGLRISEIRSHFSLSSMCDMYFTFMKRLHQQYFQGLIYKYILESSVKKKKPKKNNQQTHTEKFISKCALRAFTKVKGWANHMHKVTKHKINPLHVTSFSPNLVFFVRYLFIFFLFGKHRFCKCIFCSLSLYVTVYFLRCLWEKRPNTLILACLWNINTSLYANAIQCDSQISFAIRKLPSKNWIKKQNT